METHNARTGTAALPRATPVPHRPGHRRDDRLLPVAHRRRQPPASQRHHQHASRPGSPPGLPPATTSPPPVSRSPRTYGTWPRSPGPAKPSCGTRCPRSAPGPAAARQSVPRLPAAAAPHGQGSATRSRSTSPRTSGPAYGTAPGSAASSRSISPPPRTSSAPASTLPASPGSTGSPGSCSPRPPRASRRPPRPAARTPGSALRCSPHLTPAWTRDFRTWPRQRPTPRRSTWPPLSSATPALPAGPE